MSCWADEVEPTEQQQRFGNRAFRDWHARLEASSESLLLPVLATSGSEAAAVELSAYLAGGFGDATRIDYGTGHEMAFAMLLCALFRIGTLQETDREAVGLIVFQT